MSEIPESKISFVCTLSNGETYMEGKGLLSRIAGELSPWHKLQKYLSDNHLRITSMSLYSGNRHFNLPSSNPKFGGDVPIGFRFFRRFEDLDALSGGGGYNHFSCVEATYPEFKVQLYVDERDLDKCWVNIVMNYNG